VNGSKGVNLIPVPLRVTRQRRRRVSRWTLACAVYAGALLVSCAMVRSLYLTDRQTLTVEIEQAEKRQSELDRAARQQLAHLAALNDKAQTVHAITDQPDWSVLLAAISITMDDELVLRDLRIAPGSDAGGSVRSASATDALTGPRKYQLSLRGIGKTSNAVTKFVSRLEQTKFFDDVKLIRTGREPFMTGMAVSFDLECSFSGSGASQGQPGQAQTGRKK
jgi:Tfp pilus assembly protein PilN